MAIESIFPIDEAGSWTQFKQQLERRGTLPPTSYISFSRRIAGYHPERSPSHFKRGWFHYFVGHYRLQGPNSYAGKMNIR
jgi:hypothetical protein